MISNWKIKQSAFSDLPYISVLLICCIVAYWPVSFFAYSLKNDALNYFLPVRFQISESISNGHWPFWSPYFNLGYPLHGDMQSGVWNPFVQIFSLFGPYTLRTLHYETVLYIFISGLGMFYLLKYFSINKNICLLIGSSFMLCGYNTDSSQFLNWISAASFLPFVILFSFRSLSELSWKLCLVNGLFIYLFFITAYPADFVILLYLLVIFFCWHFFQARRNIRIKILPYLRMLSLTGVAFILLSLPAILSYIQFLPLTERGSGASYIDAMSNPLHPGLFISYLTPLPVWKADFATVTDPLLRNSYFGLATFAFLIAGFHIKNKNKWVAFCKWSFIISIIFSLGEIGGLRPLTYYTLPLMNTFRHPANARLFTIFFGGVIAAFSMQQLFISGESKKLRYSTVLIFIALVFLGVWGLSGNINLLKHSLSSRIDITKQVKEFLDSTSFYDLLLLNTLIQLPFVFILLLFSFKKISSKAVWFSGLLNVVLHAMLYMPFTAVKKTRGVAIQSIINANITKPYPLPDLSSSIKKNSINGYDFFEEIGALNMYNKQIGRIDYRITPSNLNTQNLFWKNNKLRDILIQYPLLYKADTILSLRDSSKVYLKKNKKVAFVSEASLVDSSYFHSSGFYAFANDFTPNKWTFTITSEQSGLYCFFQNYYPNWQLYIDGKKAPIISCNISCMGFLLPKGQHLVYFEYKAPYIKMAFFISLFSLIILLFLQIEYPPIKKRENYLPL